MTQTPNSTHEGREGSGDEMAAQSETVVAEAGLRRIGIGGVDVTPYLSRVEAHQADADWFVIDEEHRWTGPEYAGLVTAIPTVPQPQPVTAESIMAAYRAIRDAPPQPQPYVCSAEEYERIKAALDERGVEVDLTASPYVPVGTVLHLGPAVQANVDYRIDFPPSFDLDLTDWQRNLLRQAFTPGWSWDVPAPRRADVWRQAHLHLTAYGNAYVNLRPRRAKLRAIHTAYRAKTRRRNRRTR